MRKHPKKATKRPLGGISYMPMDWLMCHPTQSSKAIPTMVDDSQCEVVSKKGGKTCMVRY